MLPYGFLQNLVDPYLSLWVLKGPYRSSLVFLHLCVSLCVLMGPYKS